MITGLPSVLPRSLSRAAATALAFTVIAATAVSGCRKADPPVPGYEAPLPQTSGTLTVDGLAASVTVVRDRSGIPHITAANQDDLFFAQGFVQAQDRLFQIDLWRRAAQGRLSEVLGANFIERDTATRRVQYRGDLGQEWASYGPDTKSIAAAFTRGINAWIDQSREHLPEEFALAGWQPERWQPGDLLNRTDAFVASADGGEEVFRAQIIAALGVAQADRLFPPRDGEITRTSSGVDLGAVTSTLGEILRRMGASPVFSGLAAPLPGADRSGGAVSSRSDLRDRSGSNAWAVARSSQPERSPLVAGDPHRRLTTPSLRYLVHLTAPGWNVMGATSPWLPGVAIGHNDAIAWSMTASDADVQDLYVEQLNPRNPRQVRYRGAWVDMRAEPDSVPVKGRAEPFDFERLYTRNGVLVGIDADRQLAYTLRWSGTEPGAAGELASLAIDRTSSWPEFRAALRRWKMPAAEFVYGDRAGHIGRQLAGLIPRRAPGSGHVPTAAASGGGDWRGWMSLDALPSAADPPGGFLVTANGNIARMNRLTDVLTNSPVFDLEAAKRLQHDVHSWPAERLIPLLQRLHTEAPAVEAARNELVGSDRRITGDEVTALYVTWEKTVRRLLAARRVPAPLRADAIPRLPDIVTPLERPTPAWFDDEPAAARDALLLDALAAAVSELGPDREAASWSQTHSTIFVHPLSVSVRARQRFDVGPFSMPGYEDTVLALTPTTGPALQVIFDPADWDRSVGVNAPGQSSSPASAHFSDMARVWAEGRYLPLPFSASAVNESATATLVLVPRP